MGLSIACVFFEEMRLIEQKICDLEIYGVVLKTIKTVLPFHCYKT